MYINLIVLIDLGRVGRMFTYLLSVLYSVCLFRNHRNKVLAYSIFSRHTTNTLMTASGHVVAELLINSCLNGAIKIIKLILLKKKNSKQMCHITHSSDLMAF